MILHNIVHFTCIKVTLKTEDNIITPQLSSWSLTSPGRRCPWSPPWLSPRRVSSWSPPPGPWCHPSSSRATCPSSRTAAIYWTIKNEFWHKWLVRASDLNVYIDFLKKHFYSQVTKFIGFIFKDFVLIFTCLWKFVKSLFCVVWMKFSTLVWSPHHLNCTVTSL